MGKILTLALVGFMLAVCSAGEVPGLVAHARDKPHPAQSHRKLTQYRALGKQFHWLGRMAPIGLLRKQGSQIALSSHYAQASIGFSISMAIHW